MAPVRRTHRIPFNTSRLDRHGRPRPSGRLGSSGNSEAMTAHCSSVKSIEPCYKFHSGQPTPAVYEIASSQ